MAIVGIDEVGRGCLAGPVAAAAVILKCDLTGLRDSKKLSRRQREQWARNFRENGCALDIGVGWAEPAEIDKVGLTEAVRLAMTRALTGIKMPYDQVIVDGSYNFLAANPMSRAIIKADEIVPSVGAASIVAKVARDNLMRKLALSYPEYGFANNAGYGTAFHRQMIKLHGLSAVHRRSFRASV